MATTTVSDILGTYITTRYPDPRLKRMVYDGSPLMGRINKSTDSPLSFSKTVEYSGQPGSSSTFATAQNNIGQPSAQRRTINVYANEYGLFRLNGQIVRAAKKSINSVAPDIQTRANGALYSCRHSLGRALYGNGSGSIGRIASGQGTATLTLTTKGDMVNFHPGMVLVSSATETGGTVSTNTQVIGSVDVAAKTLTTVSGNWHADFDDNDYLYRQGDYDLKLKGLAAILPTGTPAALWGVTRTVDRVRLAGWDTTATSDHGTLERFFMEVSADIQAIGGKPDCIYMNNIDFAYFANTLQSRVVLKDMAARDKSKVSVNYQTIVVNGAAGPMMVYSDPFCPKGRAYMLTEDTLKLHSLGESVGWLEHDGTGQVLRVSNEDSVEGRVGGYVQMDCDFPGANATCDISALVQAA